MNVRVKYRIFVCFLLVCSILGLGYCSWEMLREMIPEQVQVSEEGEIPDLFSDTLDSFVTTEMTETLEVSSLGTGRLSSDLPDHSEEAVGVKGCSYEISCSLFGKIPLKTVSVSVVPRQKLYAGGIPIGIYMETDGVLVVDTGNIVCGDGKTCCPAENIVKSGDYIQSVDGETVGTKEELIECISSCSGSEVVLTVERNGETISLKLQPVLDQSGCYKAGIWVRNDTQGIGTLTYIREDGTFGALGHGISDIDTGDLLEISDGTLYEADVVSVVKGEQGTPGELTGVIHYSEGYKIGDITENRKDGIYGTVSGLPDLVTGRTLYETAHRQEVEQGKATILSSVDGTCREYEVEIREIRLNGKDVNKGMILEVTDEELLEKTGGIVQGMSGSPVIQNGRIVGAVTHVFVNDPTKGYGIFIENMLGNAE